MKVNIKVNDIMIQDEIAADVLLLDFLRDHGYYSVKRGCETSNCGLCTVWMDEKPILSCGMLAAQAHEFAHYMASIGAEQCGYCSPGLIMNVLAMEKELDHPSVEEINTYLAGNLCRCTGYMGQLRAIEAFLQRKDEELL